MLPGVFFLALYTVIQHLLVRTNGANSPGVRRIFADFSL